MRLVSSSIPPAHCLILVGHNLHVCWTTLPRVSRQGVGGYQGVIGLKKIRTKCLVSRIETTFNTSGRVIGNRDCTRHGSRHHYLTLVSLSSPFHKRIPSHTLHLHLHDLTVLQDNNSPSPPFEVHCILVIHHGSRRFTLSTLESHCW
jgi:hypothetical protein